MAGEFNSYHFVTLWRVPGTCVEIADIFEDTASMLRWWRPVCRSVRVLEPGSGHGLGRVVELATCGFLPITVRWRFRVVDEFYPYRSRYEADGGFVGVGAWNFEQDGDVVKVTYDWRVRAEHPLMRALGPFLRPIFALNHDWAMRCGERGLRAEVLRRRVRA